MGTTVLDPGMPSTSGLHVYAHCHPTTKGAASVLLINTSRHEPRSVMLTVSGERYTLHTERLQDTNVQLNDERLSLTGSDDLPRLAPRAAPAGRFGLLPASITFVVMPDVPPCREVVSP